jgi:hypothetical protein
MGYPNAEPPRFGLNHARALPFGTLGNKNFQDVTGRRP